MAEQPSSIKSRIAALNLEEVHAPSPAARPAYSYEQVTSKKKPPPPPPSQRPPPQQRQQSVNNPPVYGNAPTSVRQPGNQPVAAKPDTPKISPALPPRPPPRTNSRPTPPSLPPRTPSEHSLKRRDSAESVSTVASGISSLSIGSAKYGNGASGGGQIYQVRAPAYDPSKLPPLPPKKAPEDPKQSKSTLRAMKSASNIVPTRSLPPQLPSRPSLPARQESKTPEVLPEREVPKLPSRPSLPVRQESKVHEEAPSPRSGTLQLPRRSALSFGMNKSTEESPPIPARRPSPNATPDPGAPPPIPLASRPNLDAIMASKPKPGAVGFCLKCRDFSGPDSHAAQFPRQNLPSSNVGWLATQLTSPFQSATDKARVIFTWLHHNIDYDVHSFFSGTVSPSTPERTMTSGLAVCEGYAGLFCALALKAGLECIVVSGASKGFGHTPLKPGDPLPPFKSTHAWNAVHIDHGEWKLVDPCWGAGNVKGCQRTYERSFNSSMFTMDNNEFGYRHFPTDDKYFFRTDGRNLTWEEYQRDDMGERVLVYGPAYPEHGLGDRTFEPKLKHIRVHDPQGGSMVRFQFAHVCPHWDNEKNGAGKPYVMVLNVGGPDGRKTDFVPFQTDGHVYWLDVNRVELGAPGQKVSVFAVTSFDGKDGRGLSYAEYKRKKGKVAYGFGGVAMWELI